MCPVVNLLSYSNYGMVDIQTLASKPQLTLLHIYNFKSSHLKQNVQLAQHVFTDKIFRGKPLRSLI